MIPKIKELAGLGFMEFVGKLSFGFELEYQSMEGDSEDVNWDAVDREQWEMACEQPLSYLFADLELRQQVSKLEDCRIAGELDEFPKTMEYLNEIIDEARYDWINNVGWHDLIEEHTTKPEPELPSDVEHGSDASVPDGGEIRTINGHSLIYCMDLTSEIVNRNELEITAGCSYHIHVKVDGVKHSYGEALQAEMTAYLLDNWKRIPLAVRRRLLSGASRYCEPRVSREKFTAVNFHAEREDKPATWEFRLWGNVNNETDALTCLRLTAEAVHWAYKVKAGKAKSLLTGVSRAKFKQVFNYDCVHLLGLTKLCKLARTETYRTESEAA